MILALSGNEATQAPLVSVVMPVYNGAEHISEACVSVLRQSVSDLELLVVDDGSSDDSYEMACAIATLDPRLRPMRRTSNSGLPAVPRNEGVSLARGRYVAFIDHDDIWFTRKLERQLNVLCRLPQTAMVHSYLWGVKGGSPFSGLRELCPPREKATSYQSLLRGNQVQMSSVVMRSAVLCALGGFSEDQDLRAVEDFELWLRLSEEHHVAYIPEIHGLYRIRPNSISRESAHLERLSYLDQSRGTQFLKPRGDRVSRAARRLFATPGALWTHLALGSFRYFSGAAPKVF